MPKLYRKVKKVALPPGTLTAVESAAKARIRLMDYTEKNYQEKELSTIEESFGFRDSKTITWINVDGCDVEVIKKIDEHFGIHPLVLEDIVNAGQRPKFEDYGDYLFFVLKMIYFDEKINDIYSEQVVLVLSKNFVLSFQEKEGDVFDPIRQRIRESKGRIRQMGSDYLAYALLDAIVDHYFVVLERIGEQVDDLEKILLKSLKRSTPADIHKLKTQIIFLRKHIWPLREVIANFQRNESTLIKKSTEVYIRDVYDHTIQVNDTLEAFRDALSGMHDIYLSTISNQMNEVMKVLTMFAAIFIPLTFVAGIYGMNFENMPELKWPYGYFIILGIMLFLGAGMVIYFKNKKWL
jgi:magnesium transporter